MNPTKTCKTCKADKPHAAFPMQTDRRSGRKYPRAHCGDCWKLQPHKRAEYRQAERARAANKSCKPYRATGQRGSYRTIRQSQVLLCLEAHRAHAQWLRHTATAEEAAPFFTDKPWTNPRLTEAQWYAARYQGDEEFRLAERKRIAERKAYSYDSLCTTMRDALARGGASPTVEREMGFTIDQLREHLEQRFTEGMSWEAFNRGEIHIDHVIPKAAYDMGDHDQRRECWRIENLQPLWAAENQRKAARLGHPTPPGPGSSDRSDEPRGTTTEGPH